MSTLLASIKAHLKERPEQAKLTQLSLLKNLDPGEIQDTVRALYSEKDLNGWLLGRILNSIFTQKRGTFLFSKRILDDLLKRDKNRSKRKSISGTEYKELMVNLDKIFLVRLAHGSHGEHRAAVYQLVHPQLLSLLKKQVSEDVLEDQERQCLEFFNSYDETLEKTSHKSSRASANANVYENESDGQASGQPLSQKLSNQEKTKEKKSEYLVYDQANDPDFDPTKSWNKTELRLKHDYAVWFRDFPIAGQGYKNFADGFRDFVKKEYWSVFDEFGHLEVRPSKEFIRTHLEESLERRFNKSDPKPHWAFGGDICQGILAECMKFYVQATKDRRFKQSGRSFVELAAEENAKFKSQYAVELTAIEQSKLSQPADSETTKALGISEAGEQINWDFFRVLFNGAPEQYAEERDMYGLPNDYEERQPTEIKQQQ